MLCLLSVVRLFVFAAAMLIVYNHQAGRKENTIILTNGQLTISTTSGEAHVLLLLLCLLSVVRLFVFTAAMLIVYNQHGGRKDNTIILTNVH
jgi:hypothetical protein